MPGTDVVRPEVAIMIVTRNRPRLLQHALEHASRQRAVALEVVIIDDHSDYDVAAVVQPFTHHLAIKLVRLPSSNGYCAARNRGIVECAAPLIIQLDDDSWLVEDDAAAVVAAHFRADPTLGALALRIHYPWRDAPDGVGSVFPRWRGRHLSPEYTFQGCGVVFRKDAAVRAGMYPTSFTYGGEEDYLAARMLQLGYEIRMFASRRVVHGYDTIHEDPKSPEVIRRNAVSVNSHLAVTHLLLLPFPLNIVFGFAQVFVACMRERLSPTAMLRRIRDAVRPMQRTPMTWRQAAAYVRLRLSAGRTAMTAPEQGT